VAPADERELTRDLRFCARLPQSRQFREQEVRRALDRAARRLDSAQQ
jgi:hypothetical protein